MMNLGSTYSEWMVLIGITRVGDHSVTTTNYQEVDR